MGSRPRLAGSAFAEPFLMLIVIKAQPRTRRKGILCHKQDLVVALIVGLVIGHGTGRKMTYVR